MEKEDIAQTTAAEITITAEAGDEIRRIKTVNNIPEQVALRLGVKSGGGCCGASYLMMFDDQVQETDKTFQAGGLTVTVDRESLGQLNGITVRFSGGPEGRGFYFENPNDEGTCGCGGSCGCD
jgi:iron-sulfur cluster assembly protein